MNFNMISRVRAIRVMTGFGGGCVHPSRLGRASCDCSGQEARETSLAEIFVVCHAVRKDFLAVLRPNLQIRVEASQHEG